MKRLDEYQPRTDLPIIHKMPQEPTWLGYVWAVSHDGVEIFRGKYKPGHLDREGYGDCQRFASERFGGYRNIPTYCPPVTMSAEREAAAHRANT